MRQVGGLGKWLPVPLVFGSGQCARIPSARPTATGILRVQRRPPGIARGMRMALGGRRSLSSTFLFVCPCAEEKNGCYNWKFV